MARGTVSPTWPQIYPILEEVKKEFGRHGTPARCEISKLTRQVYYRLVYAPSTHEEVERRRRGGVRHTSMCVSYHKKYNIYEKVDVCISISLTPSE